MKREIWDEIVLPEIFQVTENDIKEARQRHKTCSTNNAFTYALNEILELPLRYYMISTGPRPLWKFGLSITGYFPELKVEEGMPNRLPPADGWVHYIYLPFTTNLTSKINALLQEDKTVVPFWVELYNLPDNENLLTKPGRSIYGIADQEEVQDESEEIERGITGYAGRSPNRY